MNRVILLLTICFLSCRQHQKEIKTNRNKEPPAIDRVNAGTVLFFWGNSWGKMGYSLGYIFV